MAFLTAYVPDCSIRISIDLVANHRIFGLITFGLTAMAICTGIMEEFATCSNTYIYCIISLQVL